MASQSIIGVTSLNFTDFIACYLAFPFDSVCYRDLSVVIWNISPLALVFPAEENLRKYEF